MDRRIKVTELSGGVGGARLARGLAALHEVDLTVVVNVGDDMTMHGLQISPDIDTVVYTLAGVEGPMGWGRAGDTFTFNEEIARFGLDNVFRLGDRDLALKLFRTALMGEGVPLSEITKRVVDSFDVGADVLPATDDAVPTRVRLADGWVGFHEYFVKRGHRDEVLELEFRNVHAATPAPGVVAAIEEADVLIVGPSNPLLSIAPILAIEGVREVVAGHPHRLAVSPLIGGAAVKGPADKVMISLGYRPGNQGVADFYLGLVDLLVIHSADADAPVVGVRTLATETLIEEKSAALRLARELVMI